MTGATRVTPAQQRTVPQRKRAAQAQQGRGVARWKTRTAGGAATLVEIGALWSVLELFSIGHSKLSVAVDLFYTTVFFVPVDASVVMAFALALLGIALRRRKRAALTVLTIGQCFLVLLMIVLVSTWLIRGREAFYDFDVPQRFHGGAMVAVPIMGVLSVGVLVVLVMLRPAFPARLAKGAIQRAIAVFVGGLAGLSLLGWGLTEVFHGSLVSTYARMLWATNQVIGRLLVLRPLGVHGVGPHWLSFLLGLFSAAVLLVAVALFFASLRSRRLLTARDELQIRELLAQHGERDSLGFFSTRRDKSVAFAPGGTAAVTYRVLGGCSMIGGDPVGERSAWPFAIQAWLDEAAFYGWMPAVLGASEDGAKHYAHGGLKALELGDEAILDVRDFTLAGPERKSLRQAVRRLHRSGYRTTIRRHSDIPAAEMSRLLDKADAWRGADTERGFSMALGRLGDPSDGRSVMAEAYDADGNLRGLQSFVPWGNSGLSLDLMRRDSGAVNGINEFIVADVIASAQDLGIRRISLNFAMFRAVFEEGERIGAGPVLRLWRSILTFFSRFFQLESLYRSNAKYAPDWAPRFLCYQSSRQLPRVAVVAGMAEGFLPSRRRARATQQHPMSAEFLTRVAEIDRAAEVPCQSQRRVPEQVRVRLDKADHFGDDAYPPAPPRTCVLGAIRDEFGDLAPDTRTGKTVTVAGRIMAKREHGGLCFAAVRDFSGQLQVMLSADRLGAGELADWRSRIDIGDQLSVTGEVVTSRHGELSVDANSWLLTAKCLHPLPDKRKGFTDIEARTRQRYLDLMINPSAADMLKLRNTVLRSIREVLQGQEFLEVETPMLQNVHGGANARPFLTHINAYDMRMYLRIAPELYLKRLCVAGVDRLFELNRNFRNEGADSSHNPEFTMLEAYQAYADYDVMRDLVTDLIVRAATNVYGRPVAHRVDADGEVSEVDISGPWQEISVYRAVSDALGAEIDPGTDAEKLRELCAAQDIPAAGDLDHANLVLHVYDRLVEPDTVRPTFYRDFPAAVSPLTRQHRADGRLAERWDLVAFGSEIGTGYTELTDPRIQRDRLTAQSFKAARGDAEAMELDEEFLRALEYGMPPTGGLGMGVDRVIMMLTGAPIRQTITFPFVRQSGR